MRSPSTPLPENQISAYWKNENGFSLLEVVVALAILAGGFLAVLNLFSGSVRSVDFSGQYLKAVTLANSKISELEIRGFQPDEYSGGFKNEENYRWEVDISPYESTLNEPSEGIQLQKILLKVLWEDRGQIRNVELATLRLNKNIYPVRDASLEQLFTGGAAPVSTNSETENTETETGTGTSGNICGSSTGNISGSGSVNISGN